MPVAVKCVEFFSIRKSLFIFGVVALCSLLPLVARAEVQCGSFRSRAGIDVKSCLETPEKGVEPDMLVLHLHGLGGNERGWSSYGPARDIGRALQRGGRNIAVLTPSFGAFWLLKETPTPGGQPPLMPVIEELLETTRARFRPGLPVVLVGMSLGGYNGLQLYFKRPGLLSALALGGPAVADGTPLGDEDETIRTYVNRTRARTTSAQTLVRRTREQYLDDADFERHDPLALARRTGVPSEYPPLLMQVGHDDHFGFQLGTGVLQNLLRFNGARVEFDLLSGGRGLFDHVVMDAQRTALFLSRHARRP